MVIVLEAGRARSVGLVLGGFGVVDAWGLGGGRRSGNQRGPGSAAPKKMRRGFPLADNFLFTATKTVVPSLRIPRLIFYFVNAAVTKVGRAFYFRVV